MTLGSITSPEILFKNVSENKVEFGLRIPKELAYFEGHFPNFPVVPGIVQLHWAILFAKDIYQISPVVAKGTQIKFSNLILPLDTLSLTLEHVPEKLLIIYSYMSDIKNYSSGRLFYKDKKNVL